MGVKKCPFSLDAENVKWLQLLEYLNSLKHEVVVNVKAGEPASSRDSKRSHERWDTRWGPPLLPRASLPTLYLTVSEPIVKDTPTTKGSMTKDPLHCQETHCQRLPCCQRIHSQVSSLLLRAPLLLRDIPLPWNSLTAMGPIANSTPISKDSLLLPRDPLPRDPPLPRDALASVLPTAKTPSHCLGTPLFPKGGSNDQGPPMAKGPIAYYSTPT